MTDQNGSQSKRHRRVTAQTIADLAGVSRSAVSRAFSPGAYLSAEKRHRILKIAAEAGYQPNALAVGLKEGRSNLVAVFVGSMRNPYDAAFMGCLARSLNAIRKWPILIDGTDKSANSAVEELMRYPLDALILRGGSMAPEIVEHCARAGIPMISSGRPVSAPRVDNVCCRNAEGLREMTRLLIARGRSRFGFLGGPPEFYSSAQRRAGVLGALDEAGLRPIAEATGDYTVEVGAAAARRLLRENDLDALVCANDATAIGALSAARDLSLDVPGDVAVVGFDDIAMAEWPIFNLTTVRNPIEPAVGAIIRLLEKRLADPGKPGESISIDAVIIERGTH
ncbi:transcriptional regulator, LacI family [Ruegeria lacuscaerulensis ITI-1157]|nr:transcriptional regulator, LacI family [Ruegeria lacuscaerulensis ITI-1157]SHJ79602.1 transcriptional regulator, LacI family [Ruegeria lacuscaerulensis ITI-1157]